MTAGCSVAGEHGISVEMGNRMQQGPGSVAVSPTDAAAGSWQHSDKQAVQGMEVQAVLFLWQQPRRMSLELFETILVFIYICTHTYYYIVASLLTLFHRS